MLKKLITTILLIIITTLTTQVSFAQRGIDLSLKPPNAPDIPVAVPPECPQGDWDEEHQLCKGYEDQI